MAGTEAGIDPDEAVLDPMEREMCRLAHRFTQRLDLHVRRVGEELGLTPAQVVALRELSEPITARELADRMSCEPSNVTFVLDRLERAGLVERRPHPHDRRAKELVLTPAGVDLRGRTLRRLQAQSALQPLGATELATLRDLLSRLVDGA